VPRYKEVWELLKVEALKA